MKKKSIVAIMMLITLSTSMFVACDNDKKNKEEIKIETSIKSDKINSEKINENNNSENKENGKTQEKNENSKKTISKNNKENNVELGDKNKAKKESESINFTAQKAIEIAKQKYGTKKGNIIYSYKEEPYISGNKKGYYIKLSSKTMIEQGGTGTLTWLLVTNDGKIVEDPKMS